jgi:hypothetical protein
MFSRYNQQKFFWNMKKILAFLFGVGVILGFLLTPLGFETRMNELRTPVFAGFFITVGLLIPIAGLVLLFRNQKIAAALAVIDGSLLFFTAPADQARFFFTIPPPLAVRVGEYILILIGIGYLLFGLRVYLEESNQKGNQN